MNGLTTHGNFLGRVLLIGLGTSIGVGAVPAADPEPVVVIGYTEPFRSIEIAAPEAGVIGEIDVREGDRVIKGELLIKLDCRVLEAQREIVAVEAKSDGRLQSATAQHELNQKRLDSVSALRSKGSASATELERARTTVEMSRGDLDVAEENAVISKLQLKEIESRIEQRTLRSPVDGIVTYVGKDVSEAVNAGPVSENNQEQALVQIVQLDQLRLTIHLPAVIAITLERGDSLPMTIHLQAPETASAKPPGDPGDATTGTIDFLSPVIDPASATVRAELLIDNKEARFFSGSYARVLLPPPSEKSGTASTQATGNVEP